MADRIVIERSKVLNNISHTLYGFITVKTFGLENNLSNKLAKSLQYMKSNFIKIAVLESLISSLIEPVVIICVIIVFIFFQVSFSSFVLMVLAISRINVFVRVIQSMRYKITIHQSSAEAANKLLQNLQLHSLYTDSNGKGNSFTAKISSINIIDVTYKYDDGRSFVLGPVNLTLTPGQTIGLVGESGSGKSSIAKLILGFLIPDSGTININGKDIAELSSSQYRKKIGYVQQDIYLFNDTILNNIILDKSCYDLNDVQHVCKLVDIHGFIEQLPNGYQTVIVENAIRLSGGQKQRIALARAIIRKPEILILDEATSSLDNISEAKILEMLKHLSVNIVTIVIAHRLSIVEGVDTIYVFDNGRVVETGSFEQLKKANGHFANLHAHR